MTATAPPSPQLFVYDAIGDDGAIVRGEASALDELSLALTLERQGLSLLRLRPLHAWWRRQNQQTSTRGIKSQDVLEMARYLAITTRAGLPIVESLREFGEDSRSPAMSNVCDLVVADISSGATLSDAFAHFPKVFNELFLSMVRAGERSGTIEVAMERVADQMTFQADVRSQLKGALIPPTALLIAIFGLIVLLLTFLLPQILGMLLEAGVELPLPTRIVMGLSDFLLDNVVLLVGGAVAGVVAVNALNRTARGALTIHRGVLRIPAIGGLVRMSGQARLVGSMTTLLEAGVDAVAALELASTATGSPLLRKEAQDVLQRAREGESLGHAITSISALNPLLARMIKLGESTGRLGESLAVAGDHFAKQIPREVKHALSLLEPLIIAGAGVVVGFILLSVLLPMFSLYDTF